MRAELLQRTDELIERLTKNRIAIDKLLIKNGVAPEKVAPLRMAVLNLANTAVTR